MHTVRARDVPSWCLVLALDIDTTCKDAIQSNDYDMYTDVCSSPLYIIES